MSKLSLTPPKIFGALILGLLLMWIGSEFDNHKWLFIPLIIIGWLIAAVAFSYGLYQWVKILKGKF